MRHARTLLASLLLCAVLTPPLWAADRLPWDTDVCPADEEEVTRCSVQLTSKVVRHRDGNFTMPVVVANAPADLSLLQFSIRFNPLYTPFLGVLDAACRVVAHTTTTADIRCVGVLADMPYVAGAWSQHVATLKFGPGRHLGSSAVILERLDEDLARCTRQDARLTVW